MILKNKAKTLRNLGIVDVSALKNLVLSIPQGIWDMETSKRENNAFCFSSTEHIIFKFIKDVEQPGNSFEKPLWQIWQSKLIEVIEHSVQSYSYANGRIPKVMLAKLLAGGTINEHIDICPRDQMVHKIHIPLQTDEAVTFYIENQEYHLEEGYAYEVNNVVKHRIENNSKIDRIHLIFEYYNEGV